MAWYATGNPAFIRAADILEGIGNHWICPFPIIRRVRVMFYVTRLVIDSPSLTTGHSAKANNDVVNTSSDYSPLFSKALD